jgi:tRNA splicing ligase
MYDSRWVQVKNLNDNVISFNFTRDAFEKDKWDTITCHARGLFVDKTNGQVVARSFGKFFNYRQHETTEPQYMKEHIAWPLIGYKKENGFLGIVSKYNGKVRFFTKSSDEGDYVNWFIGVLCDNYDINVKVSIGKSIYTRYSELYNYSIQQENLFISSAQEIMDEMKFRLIDKLNPLLEEGYSYVFECIDKDNDPHIIKYKDNNVVLLEVFKNQLKEEHVSWKELHEIADRLVVPCKSQELRFNNWEEFEEWKDKFRQGVTQWDCKHEGYVFEDQNNYRVKFKSSFYNFWKQMRAVKDALAGGRQNKKIYKTKEEIQVVKILERHTREELQNMSIIDIEDEFYKEYEVVTC